MVSAKKGQESVPEGASVDSEPRRKRVKRQSVGAKRKVGNLFRWWGEVTY